MKYIGEVTGIMAPNDNPRFTLAGKWKTKRI